MTRVSTIPPVAGALPGVGHLVPMMRDPLGFLGRAHEQGPLVRVQAGPATALLVCDLELTRQVLLAPRVFDKGGVFFNRFSDVVGNGLGTCPYAEHRRQRRLAQPAFHPSRLPGYADVMTRRIEEMSAGWHDGGVIEVAPEMLRLSVRIAVETMFGSGLPARILDEACDDLQRLMGGLFRRMFVPPLLSHIPLVTGRGYERARQRLRHTIREIVAQRRRSPDPGTDLLAMLLAEPAEGDDFAPLSDLEVEDQVISLFVAGSDTAAGTLAWAFCLLGWHPQIDREVAAEAQAVLQGGPARHDHLPELQVADRVITEVLRLYPAAWIITRTAAEDADLAGHRIPRGTTIVISPYAVHRNPDLFHQPELFDPNRPENRERGPRNPLIPFGVGTRKCLGDTFAMIQTTLTLAGITSRWQLTHVNDGPLQTRPAMLSAPQRLWMRTNLRNDEIEGSNACPGA